MRLAAQHGVTLAPFFIFDAEGEARVVTSALRAAKELSDAPSSSAPAELDLGSAREELAALTPPEVVRWALSRFAPVEAQLFTGSIQYILIGSVIVGMLLWRPQGLLPERLVVSQSRATRTPHTNKPQTDRETQT